MHDHKLLRILGAGFSIAVIIGAVIGVGILRTPGEVAGHLASTPLILGLWLGGGIYALLAAASVTELGTMLPETGGYFIFRGGLSETLSDSPSAGRIGSARAPRSRMLRSRSASFSRRWSPRSQGKRHLSESA